MENSIEIPWASQVVLVVKNLPANAEDVRDAGLIPRSGKSPGEGHGSLLQYSGSSLDRRISENPNVVCR